MADLAMSSLVVIAFFLVFIPVVAFFLPDEWQEILQITMVAFLLAGFVIVGYLIVDMFVPLLTEG
jgi:L-lactate permease